jgi:hypothetical protein
MNLPTTDLNNCVFAMMLLTFLLFVPLLLQ